MVLEYTLHDIPVIAKKLYALTERYTVIMFTGSLGAGKTTLIREICACAGVHEPVTSPTFTYLNIYAGQETKIYHFDLYRLQTLDSFYEAGFNEYFDASNSLVFVEWPEIILPVIHGDHVLRIDIDHKNGARVLHTSPSINL